MAQDLVSRSRGEYWQDILGITERLSGFSLETAPQYLEIDCHIHPRFPSPQAAVQKLLEATVQNLSRTTLDLFESKCSILQEQTLLRYKSTVAKTESLFAQTGIDDREQQTRLSAAFETWYNRSEGDLISAIKTSLDRKVSQACLVGIHDFGRRILRGLRNQMQTKDMSACGKMGKLHQAFEMNPSPNDKEREVLAEACEMTYKQVSHRGCGEDAEYEANTFRDKCDLDTGHDMGESF